MTAQISISDSHYWTSCWASKINILISPVAVDHIQNIDSHLQNKVLKLKDKKTVYTDLCKLLKLKNRKLDKMDSLSSLKQACVTRFYKSFKNLQVGEYIVTHFEKKTTGHGERVRITIDDL